VALFLFEAGPGRDTGPNRCRGSIPNLCPLGFGRLGYQNTFLLQSENFRLALPQLLPQDLGIVFATVRRTQIQLPPAIIQANMPCTVTPIAGGINT